MVVVTQIGPCDQGCRCGLTIFEVMVLVAPLLAREEIRLPLGYRWEEDSLKVLPGGYRVRCRVGNAVVANEAADDLDRAVRAALESVTGARLVAWTIGGGYPPS